MRVVDVLSKEQLHVSAPQVMLREPASFFDKFVITFRNLADENSLVCNHHHRIFACQLKQKVTPNLKIILAGTQPRVADLSFCNRVFHFMLGYDALGVEVNGGA